MEWWPARLARAPWPTRVSARAGSQGADTRVGQGKVEDWEMSNKNLWKDGMVEMLENDKQELTGRMEWWKSGVLKCEKRKGWKNWG